MKYHISKHNKITTTYKFYLWSVCDAETERPIRDIFESMRNGQFFQSSGGTELYPIRHQPDDGRVGRRTGRAAVRPHQPWRDPDRQRDTSFALYPGTGKPEDPAAAGGVQHQPQGGGQAACGQLFQHHHPLDMNYSILAQRVRYFKEDTKGVAAMCRAMEKMRDETEHETSVKHASDCKIQPNEFCA